MTQLVVTSGFGGYGAGVRISDPTAIAAILAGPNHVYVVQVADDAGSTGPVIPAQPNAVTLCVGLPDPSIAALYGYALDLTSTPATLYHWSGTAWVAVVVAGGGGAPAPVLAALTLSKLTGTAGVAFSANITGQTAGSTLAATSDDGTVLAIANGVVSGTFATAGSKHVSLVETLAGATGSPKTTTLAVTISAAAPVLQALGLASLDAVAGTPFSAAISGLTVGSTVAAASNDGTALTISNGVLSGTFAAAGTPTVTLTETLAGATGSPKSTQFVITVSATAPDPTITTDLSNPDRGLSPLIN